MNNSVCVCVCAWFKCFWHTILSNFGACKTSFYLKKLQTVTPSPIPRSIADAKSVASVCCCLKIATPLQLKFMIVPEVMESNARSTPDLHGDAFPDKQTTRLSARGKRKIGEGEMEGINKPPLTALDRKSEDKEETVHCQLTQHYSNLQDRRFNGRFMSSCIALRTLL